MISGTRTDCPGLVDVCEGHCGLCAESGAEGMASTLVMDQMLAVVPPVSSRGSDSADGGDS